MAGIAPPLNPQSQVECQTLSERWSGKRKDLENARSACERRDGGTVTFKDGPWMPNCKSRQQAFVACASLTDQICWVDAQQSESVAACYRQVSQNQNAKRDAESLAGRVERRAQELRDARRSSAAIFNGVLPSPSDAGAKLQSNIKEAARTTAAPGADSQPALNRVGKWSDRAAAFVPSNPIAAEIGAQSSAAARARMGDALQQLEGALRQNDGNQDSAFEHGRSTSQAESGDSNTYVGGTPMGSGHALDTYVGGTPIPSSSNLPNTYVGGTPMGLNGNPSDTYVGGTPMAWGNSSSDTYVGGTPMPSSRSSLDTYVGGTPMPQGSNSARAFQREDRDEERAEAAAGNAADLQMLQRLNQSLQSVTATLRSGATSSLSSDPRPASLPARPKCRLAEVVGPDVDRSLPLCR